MVLSVIRTRGKHFQTKKAGYSPFFTEKRQVRRLAQFGDRCPGFNRSSEFARIFPRIASLPDIDRARARRRPRARARATPGMKSSWEAQPLFPNRRRFGPVGGF